MTNKSKKKRPFWEIFNPKNDPLDSSDLEKVFDEGAKKVKELQKNKKNKTSSMNQTFDGQPE